MPGAYVAKPAVVSTPDVPPGWDPDWPIPGETGYDPDPFFPAPYPPGYEPDFSFVLFGTESIAYDGAASVTGTFRDHDTYATNEPDVITWTATVSSSPTRNVKLRFSGDEDYTDSISSACVFGTYWGATPDIEFELEEEDTGGTIVLTGKSAISGSYIAATLAIEVAAAILTVTSTSSLSGGWAIGCGVLLDTDPFDVGYSSELQRDRNYVGEERNWVDFETRTYPYSHGTDDIYKTTVDDDGIICEIQYSMIPEESTLVLKYSISAGGDAGTVTITWELEIAGTTYTKVFSGNPIMEYDTWLTIDNTGEVTLINP